MSIAEGIVITGPAVWAVVACGLVVSFGWIVFWYYTFRKEAHKK